MEKLTKKYLQVVLSTLSAFMFVSAYAATNFSQKNCYYVAANTGIYQGMLNQVYSDKTDFISQTIAESILQNGYTIGAALGYSRVMNDLYLLGGEFTANLLTGYGRFNSGASTTAFRDVTKAKYNLDFTFVPGLILTETTAAYLKLGLTWAYFTDELSSPSGFLAIGRSYSSQAYQLGFIAGIGLKRFITPCSYLFVEYNYHDYGSMNFASFINFTAEYGHSTRAYANSVVVGAGYHFA